MKQLYSALILMVFACSCSQDEITQEQAYSTINFTSARMDVTPTTKSTSFLPNGNKVGISPYLVTLGVEATDYSQTKKFTVSDISGNLTPDDGKAMLISPGGGTDYKFYAYSPATDFNSGSKKTLSVANGTDFMVSSVAKSVASSLTVTLPAMTRKCSEIEFLVQCTSGTYIKSLTIAPNGLTLNNLTHSPVNYTLGGAEMDVSAAATDATYSVPQSSFVTHTAGVEYLVDVPVLPKPDAALSFSLDINLTTSVQGNATTTTALQTMKATLPHLPFVRGYKYRYVLTFCDPGVVLQLQVLPWNTVTTTNNIGPGGQITEAVWNTLLGANTQGTGSGVLSPADWSALIATLNLGDLQGGFSFTSTAWLAAVNNLIQGLYNGTITIPGWQLINGVLTQGNSQNGFVLPTWITAASILTQGDLQGGFTTTVGAWSTGITWNNSVGTPQAAVSVANWVTNPNWTAIMGNVMNSLNIVGWNTSSGSPSMGQ